MFLTTAIYLHPFKVLRGPLTVECDADLKEFLELSKLDDVKFAVELCVSIKTDNDKEDQQTFPADSLELVKIVNKYNQNKIIFILYICFNQVHRTGNTSLLTSKPLKKLNYIFFY